MFLSTTLTVLFYSIAVVLFPLALFLLLDGETLLVTWEISSLATLPVSAQFSIDPLPTLLGSALYLIAGSVVLFSQGYFGSERHTHRFYALLSLFVLSMTIFIFSNNLISMLLGWDGLGIVSYLLVMYYPSPRSSSAGMSVMMTNRVGDVGLLLAIGWAVSQGHWQLSLTDFSGPLALSLLLAAVTKSAQFPFSTWLPLAMAAPTPVSALVHSSTLVTAGVYLLIRTYTGITVESSMPPLLLSLGIITMLAAGGAALVETDLKKVVALSTLSQLGLMFCALGLHSPVLAFYHLMTHAMFKALLFLCVGTFIFYHGHSQDIRSMGQLAQTLPLSQSAASLAHLALAGFPWLTAFYSKEPIFEVSLHTWGSAIVPSAMWLGIILTSSYSVRASVLPQLEPLVGSPVNLTHNTSWAFNLSILVLGLAAISAGGVLHWLLMLPATQPMAAGTAGVALVGMLLGLIGAAVSPGTFSWSRGRLQHKVVLFLSSLSYLSLVSGTALARLPLQLGKTVLSQVDQGWLEQSTSRGLTGHFGQLGQLVTQIGCRLPVTNALFVASLATILILFSC